MSFDSGLEGSLLSIQIKIKNLKSSMILLRHLLGMLTLYQK